MLLMSVAGATPDIPQTNSYPSQPGIESYSPDEQYRRTFQGNQIQHRILQDRGIDDQLLGARNDDSPLEAAARQASEEQAAILYANQSGEDDRSSNAVRGSLQSTVAKGKQNIYKNIAKEGQKEIAKIGVSFTNTALATAFSEGADAGVSDTLTSMHNAARAVVTIMVPKQEVGEIENLNDVQKVLFNESVETFFPRYNLYTMSGLSGIITFIGQFLIIALLVVAGITLIVSVVVVMNQLQQAAGNPFATWLNFGTSAWMSILQSAIGE
jgi:hypothetical protein